MLSVPLRPNADTDTPKCQFALFYTVENEEEEEAEAEAEAEEEILKLERTAGVNGKL